MQTNKLIHSNYTTFQLVLPLDLGIKISEDDELITYCELMKGINLEKYLKMYEGVGRKPKNRVAILNTILFGFMIDIRSTRKIKKACETDIRFMYLLEGSDALSHTLINTIIQSLEVSIDNLFKEIFDSINEKEIIDTSITYIDGTKIEADANRYTFVWKKSVIKNRDKLYIKVNKEIDTLNKIYETEDIKLFTPKDKYPSEELFGV